MAPYWAKSRHREVGRSIFSNALVALDLNAQKTSKRVTNTEAKDVHDQARVDKISARSTVNRCPLATNHCRALSACGQRLFTVSQCQQPA